MSGTEKVLLDRMATGRVRAEVLAIGAGGFVGGTLTFGATGKERSLAFCNPNGEDVNGDGRLDLVCHFTTGDTGLKRGDRQAALRGRTVQDGLIEGSAEVLIVN